MLSDGILSNTLVRMKFIAFWLAWTPPKKLFCPPDLVMGLSCVLTRIQLTHQQKNSQRPTQLQFLCMPTRSMPTQKFFLLAGPKFEPFYVSLQVAAQSDATYVPGYSWHVNKRVPDGNINYSCHGTAQPSYQLLGREGHLWQWGHLWKQNYWQYSLQADNSFHRPNSNSHPGRYTGSAYTSARRVLTFVWS